MTTPMTPIEILRAKDAEITARVTALGLHGMARAAMRMPFAVALPLTPEMEEMIGNAMNPRVQRKRAAAAKKAEKEASKDFKDEAAEQLMVNREKADTLRVRKAVRAHRMFSKGESIAEIGRAVNTDHCSVVRSLLSLSGIAVSPSDQDSTDKLIMAAAAVRGGIDPKKASAMMKVDAKRISLHLRVLEELAKS